MINKAPFDNTELVELLHQSAVEQLITTYHQLALQDFSSVVIIIQVEFQALCMYKCGNYHQLIIKRNFEANDKKKVFQSSLQNVSLTSTQGSYPLSLYHFLGLGLVKCSWPSVIEILYLTILTLLI